MQATWKQTTRIFIRGQNTCKVKKQSALNCQTSLFHPPPKSASGLAWWHLSSVQWELHSRPADETRHSAELVQQYLHRKSHHEGNTDQVLCGDGLPAAAGAHNHLGQALSHVHQAASEGEHRHYLTGDGDVKLGLEVQL